MDEENKMKIFVICSKHFYDKVPAIKKELEEKGHIIQPPNSYDKPFEEERMKSLSAEEHIGWKSMMLRKDEENVLQNDAVLVLNFEKRGIQNYIGGATFLEIYTAWKLNRKIFLYNPIPDLIFKDELIAFSPLIINGDLSQIK